MSSEIPYPSKLPHRVYADSEEEQRKQLEADALMQRFAESRQALSHDPYRPQFHYVNPEGNLNDPNGLCCWQGRYHLFYQAYPPEDPRQHWGHAVSDDLVRWSDLPLAIYPGIERSCFSGSTVVEEDRVDPSIKGTDHETIVQPVADLDLLQSKRDGQGLGLSQLVEKGITDGLAFRRGFHGPPQ